MTLAETADPTWYLIGDLVGTWLSAIGTIAAAGLAAWLGLRAVREQRALQEERERAQADRVTLVRRSPRSGEPFLTVRNESDQLISAVRVVALGSFENETRDVDLIPADVGLDFSMTGVASPSSVAVVEFDDAAGRTWVRTSKGALRRAHRQTSGTSLHLRYRMAGEPKGELASVTVTLQRGAMLMAYQQAAEPAAIVAPARRVRVMISMPRRAWARLTRR
ncbi:hypothetical protein ACIG47_13315 [Promicromonospora sp. NPDC052451]|uniref:hypothetical protein n=1 Tax=Promicromonospora sp. NPDC052451 TaxID=3364407 RepID=UPI0037CAC0A2